MSLGFLLALEGLDGAGKTTLAHRLRQELSSLGQRVVVLKEPTQGPVGQKIRTLLKDGRPGWLSPDAELELFIEDRQWDVTTNINPALAQGGVVILDRYIISNLAYQGALGLDPAKILAANTQFPWPDATALLEVSPALGLKRITQSRGEKPNLAFERADFLEKVQAVFNSIFNDPSAYRLTGLHRLDGQQSPEELTRGCLNLLRPFLAANPAKA
ncbi:MAG: dTMP kinase [Deltaproteobacteria bacterium]|jgi:dTMP kinase|nr:dTMP kinase [Deltaproteobacteria bacterium]